jgi:hypothetical protein
MLNDRGQVDEVGSRTRRRPIGLGFRLRQASPRQDAAAKDAASGLSEL